MKAEEGLYGRDRAAGTRVRGSVPLWVALLASLVLGASRTAGANGAFPDSLGILLPADRPGEIFLATNFGLIWSQDEGKTWSWSCEQTVASLANLYQVGPPPVDRIFAISSSGLIYSNDKSCNWSIAGGTLANAPVTDAFADPTEPTRVLAIGSANSTDGSGGSIYASTDGGVTFGPPLFTAPAGNLLTGVELARSDPKIVYATMVETPGTHPRLLRSADGGQTWDAPLDVEAQLGPNTPRIIAVDPSDPRKIFLRVSKALGEILAVSSDGGTSFQTPVKVAFELTAFARLASGTILVAGTDSDPKGNQIAAGYRSTDGGSTFRPWPVPRLRALAERNGELYGAADDLKDQFALGVSTDEGRTFTPLMTYDKVTSVMGCVQAVCAESCRTEASQGLWSASVCSTSNDGTDNVAENGCACGAAGRADLSGLAFVAVVAWRRRKRGATRPTQRPAAQRMPGRT